MECHATKTATIDLFAPYIDDPLAFHRSSEHQERMIVLQEQVDEIREAQSATFLEYVRASDILKGIWEIGRELRALIHAYLYLLIDCHEEEETY
jgi:hypothetical protein